jgi:threonyl-tRNA synthetase
VDFNLPVRFDLEYVGPDGNRHRVYMVHRAIFGSLERFFAGLVEHWKGAFPIWLAPVQVQVIPVTEAHIEGARAAAARLKAAGLRVEVDEDREKVSKKIRKAQLLKVPYMAVIGEREIAGGTVALRHRKDGDLGTVAWDALVRRLEEEIRERR